MDNELANILSKVGVMYQRYGIKSVTMDDVSRELGISKKTLYKYVKDKVELVEKVFSIESDKIEDSFNTLKELYDNAIIELIEMNRLVYEMMKSVNPATLYDLRKYYPVMFLKFAESRRAKMFEWIRDNIKKGKKQGLFRKELNEEVIAKIYVSRVDGAWENEICSIHDLITNKFFTEMLIYHIRGISNEKGIEVLEKNSNKLKFE